MSKTALEEAFDCGHTETVKILVNATSRAKKNVSWSTSSMRVCVCVSLYVERGWGYEEAERVCMWVYAVAKPKEGITV